MMTIKDRLFEQLQPTATLANMLAPTFYNKEWWQEMCVTLEKLPMDTTSEALEALRMYHKQLVYGCGDSYIHFLADCFPPAALENADVFVNPKSEVRIQKVPDHRTIWVLAGESGGPIHTQWVSDREGFLNVYAPSNRPVHVDSRIVSAEGETHVVATGHSRVNLFIAASCEAYGSTQVWGEPGASVSLHDEALDYVNYLFVDSHVIRKGADYQRIKEAALANDKQALLALATQIIDSNKPHYDWSSVTRVSKPMGLRQLAVNDRLSIFVTSDEKGWLIREKKPIRYFADYIQQQGRPEEASFSMGISPSLQQQIEYMALVREQKPIVVCGGHEVFLGMGAGSWLARDRVTNELLQVWPLDPSVSLRQDFERVKQSLQSTVGARVEHLEMKRKLGNI